MRYYLKIVAAIGLILCIVANAHAENESVIKKVKGFFSATPTPGEVVATYLEATKMGNFAAAYKLLSSEDQAARSKQKFINSQRMGYERFGAFTSMAEFKVVNVTSDDNEATVTVETTHPDLKIIMGVLLRVALTGNKEGVDKAIKAKLASGDVPMTTTTSTMTLTREEKGWRIYEGYKLKDLIAQLSDEAEQLEKQGRYDDALNKYDELLGLKGHAVEYTGKIQRKREKVSVKRKKAVRKAAQAKINAAYIDKLKLYAIEARYRDTYLDKRVPSVTFKIKNEGDKTLSRVEVTVYFKDAEGNIIAEETYHPIHVDSNPLKPGYIWRIERGQIYVAKSVPSEWAPGSAVAKITNIEIAGSK